jgi:hypothetical protein
VDNTTPYTSMNKMALPVKSNNNISGEAINWNDSGQTFDV